MGISVDRLLGADHDNDLVVFPMGTDCVAGDLVA